ncbi:MAG: PAS domain-containing protein [Pseudomonadota bacterium]
MNTIATPGRKWLRLYRLPDGARSVRDGAGIPQRLSRLARILPVVAVLMPLTMVFGAAWLTWREVKEDAAIAMRRSAGSAAEYAARALSTYTVAVGRMNDRLTGLTDDDIRADENRLHLELRRILGEISHGDAAMLLDRNGAVLVSSERFPVDRAERHLTRSHFTALREAPSTAVHVGPAARSAETREYVFPVARRREGSGNFQPGQDVFDGVALIFVRSGEVADGLRQLLMMPTDTIALMHDNGDVLAITSGEQAAIARAPVDGPIVAAMAGRGPRIFETLPDTWMPGVALGAVTPVSEFAAHALALRPRAELAAAWRTGIKGHVAFALPATLMLLLLSLKVRRDQIRLADMNQGLRGDVARGMDRLRRAEEIGMIGTFEFHTRSGVNIRSAEYMSLHGLPAVETRETHEDWVRRLHPDDRDRAEAHVLAALADPSREDYSQTYRIVTPKGEIRWIMSRGRIERDRAGKPVYLRGAHLDVTQLRMTELALADTDARLRLAQEAVGIGTWEWVPSAGTLTCSRRMAKLWGLDDASAPPTLAEMLACVKQEDQDALRALITDERVGVNLRGEFRLRRPSENGGAPVTWVAVRASFQAGDLLAPARMIGVAYDITDRKQSEELTTIMAHEVEHRAKNALMVVSSLLRMTKADSAEALVEVMDARVRALSRTLGLLGQGRWRGAALRDIIQNEVGHFAREELGQTPSITLDGPAVTIEVDAAQPLSMAMHELATNAAKYGALSALDGTLHIEWWMEGATLRLRWTERGGPPLAGAPSQLGFGSHLIRTLIESQLQGTITKQWEAAGLVCNIALPLGCTG